MAHFIELIEQCGKNREGANLSVVGTDFKISFIFVNTLDQDLDSFIVELDVVANNGHEIFHGGDICLFGCGSRVGQKLDHIVHCSSGTVE